MAPKIRQQGQQLFLKFGTSKDQQEYTQPSLAWKKMLSNGSISGKKNSRILLGNIILKPCLGVLGAENTAFLKSLGTENATPLLKNGQQLDNKKGWLQEWVLHRKAFCGYKMRNRIFGTRPRVSEEETLTLDLDNWGCS